MCGPASPATAVPAITLSQPPLSFPQCLQIFRYSIWEGRPLPGMALMNLRFRDEAAVQRQRRQALAVAAAAATATTGGGAGLTSSASISSSDGSSTFGSPGDTLGRQQQLAGGRNGVEGPGLSRTQRWLYCAGVVLLRYAWARLGHAAAAAPWEDGGGWARGSWRRRCLELMQRGESTYRLASLANFLVFLHTGRYRSAFGRADAGSGRGGRVPTAAARLPCAAAGRRETWAEYSPRRALVLHVFSVALCRVEPASVGPSGRSPRWAVHNPHLLLPPPLSPPHPQEPAGAAAAGAAGVPAALSGAGHQL